jgi:hypothetical protein
MADQITCTMIVAGARLDVTIESGKLLVSQTDLLAWVQNAAESVSTYYRRFPLPRVAIRISPFDGRGVRHGQTFGRDGGFIRIQVGSETPAAALADDWMLTHEMIHLAFPSVADDHHWIEEGISTYVEPIARIRAGHLSENQMWVDLLRDLPKGLPSAGDQGLDRTHTWARTYWGGALFCFLADVDIRRQTNMKKGLEDALRAILDAGGDIRWNWDLSQALKIGDQATGVSVLTNLYEKMKDQPVDVDLPAMWKQLGVARDANAVHLADDAPLAAVRRAIVYGDPASTPVLSHPVTVLAGRTRNSPSCAASAE